MQTKCYFMKICLLLMYLNLLCRFGKKKEKKKSSIIQTREMKGRVAGKSDNQETSDAGLEGTGPNLSVNRHGSLISASNDQNLSNILHQIKSSKSPAVINYGATWCRVCNQILPAFCQLSNKFPKLSLVYADIDECPETTQHIRYTPTFHFYHDGERVDEMFGAGEQRLHDRLWLHS